MKKIILTTLISFGLAIEAMKRGCAVARSGWNGKEMFIFIRPSDELSADFLVNNVRSIPKVVKDYFRAMFSWTAAEEASGNGPKDKKVKFGEYICMKAADGSIVNGWLASQTDILADDWMIVGG